MNVPYDVWYDNVSNKLIQRRNDLIDMLGDLLKNDSKFDEIAVVGTAMTFLIAGTTTSTNTLSYISWELAKNPDIQKKLRKEIQSHFSNKNDVINHEKLQHLQYLDMVISEALRRHAPVPVVTRGCSKKYFFEDGNCTFNEDEEIHIPIAAIMMDEK